MPVVAENKQPDREFRWSVNKSGAPDPAREAAEVSAKTGFALATVCKIVGAPRSSVYARAAGGEPGGAKRGPRTQLSDEELLEKIRTAITDSPFSGEGHRKVCARLRREHGIRVGRKRVLRLMREAGLLAPQRARGRRRPRPHDGTIIPGGPNLIWANATKLGSSH
jgi:putative transposase